MAHTVGLAEAARLTGKSQSTIHRAMKKGLVSFTAEGAVRRIDVAELTRVFGVGDMADTLSRHDQRQPAQGGDAVTLQGMIDLQADTIRELRADKEDLRRRLDQATALLTDQREKTAPPTSAWGRFLAWRRGR